MTERSAPWLLVPVKSLTAGKQRLSGVLDDAQRQRLNRFLLRRTLAAAAGFPGLGRTAVVSDDEDVLAFARSAGARAIHTPRRGLNAALADGRRTLVEEGAAALIVLPVDLPAVRPIDLEEIARLGLRHGMVICPDRHGAGTNALYVSSAFEPDFRFGADSFRLHREEARRCGATPKLLFNANIAMDVDLPADLAILEDAVQWHRNEMRFPGRPETA